MIFYNKLLLEMDSNYVHGNLSCYLSRNEYENLKNVMPEDESDGVSVDVYVPMLSGPVEDENENSLPQS